MDNTLLEFLVLCAVFLALALPAYLVFGEHEERGFDGPHHLSSLNSHMRLRGSANWEVSIVRRSGYLHDAWTFTGSASGALQTATQKMRQARQEDVAITVNNEEKFAVVAFYESQGRRRTGKYIGGFEITRSSQS